MQKQFARGDASVESWSILFIAVFLRRFVLPSQKSPRGFRCPLRQHGSSRNFSERSPGSRFPGRNCMSFVLIVSHSGGVPTRRNCCVSDFETFFMTILTVPSSFRENPGRAAYSCPGLYSDASSTIQIPFYPRRSLHFSNRQRANVGPYCPRRKFLTRAKTRGDSGDPRSGLPPPTMSTAQLHQLDGREAPAELEVDIGSRSPCVCTSYGHNLRADGVLYGPC